jgi:hypothetical protein
VQTDTIAMGLDSDGDGVTDKEEYLDGTNPLLSGDRLRVTAFSITTPNTNFSLTFTSTVARLYMIQTSLDLASWTLDTNFGIAFAPDAGASTTRSPLNETSATKRFFRVISVKPLAP